MQPDHGPHSMEDSLLYQESAHSSCAPELLSATKLNPVPDYTLCKQAVYQDVSLACLHHIERFGRFNILYSSIPTDDTSDGELQTVEIGTDHVLEDEWRHYYEL